MTERTEVQIEAQALLCVQEYADGERSAATEEGRPFVEPTEELTSYQAQRAAQLAVKLSSPGAVVLSDPVGTGKTVVALAAASLLLKGPLPKRARVDRVLVVAPSTAVRKLWLRRARHVGLGGPPVTFKTRRKLPVKRAPLGVRRRTLVIVDESHRGLQNVENSGYARVARHAADTRLLLVSATPFQLSARGFVNMLGLASSEDFAEGRAFRQVDPQPITRFATAVAELLRAEHDADPDTTEERARAKVAQTEPAARTAMEPFFISPFDRSRIGLNESPAIPEVQPLQPPKDWVALYHTLRVIPELPDFFGQPGEIRSSDSYQRMLLSSHRAILEHQAIQDFTAWAETDRSPKGVGNLLSQLKGRLMQDERTHPKVGRTAEWVAQRLRGGRHVLVFCVYRHTQSALLEAISAEVGDPDLVRAPGDVTEAMELHKSRFGRPPGGTVAPLAIVVRDFLSESVDLDGGMPCVVHHDLVWNPVRWDQRMGRVVRASSGFREVKEEDVFLPVLGVAADKRLYESMRKRKNLAGEVLRLATLVGDEEGEDGESEPQP